MFAKTPLVSSVTKKENIVFRFVYLSLEVYNPNKNLFIAATFRNLFNLAMYTSIIYTSSVWL